jgi:hypothetical protein
LAEPLLFGYPILADGPEIAILIAAPMMSKLRLREYDRCRV